MRWSLTKYVPRTVPPQPPLKKRLIVMTSPDLGSGKTQRWDDDKTPIENDKKNKVIKPTNQLIKPY